MGERQQPIIESSSGMSDGTLTFQNTVGSIRSQTQADQPGRKPKWLSFYGIWDTDGK